MFQNNRISAVELYDKNGRQTIISDLRLSMSNFALT